MREPHGVGRILVPCVNRLYGPVLTLRTYHTHYDMESCDQGAFLIRFPEVLQSLPSTSHKIKLNCAILMMILGGILVPCVNCLYGLVLTLQTYHAHHNMESCDQGAFLIGFLEPLQSLPSMSHKIKFNRATLTMILPCQ